MTPTKYCIPCSKPHTILLYPSHISLAHLEKKKVKKFLLFLSFSSTENKQIFIFFLKTKLSYKNKSVFALLLGLRSCQFTAVGIFTQCYQPRGSGVSLLWQNFSMVSHFWDCFVWHFNQVKICSFFLLSRASYSCSSKPLLAFCQRAVPRCLCWGCHCSGWKGCDETSDFLLFRLSPGHSKALLFQMPTWYFTSAHVLVE